jgi:hypothetical protein
MHKIEIHNTVEKYIIDQETLEAQPRSAEIIAAEEQALKDAKAAEIQSKVDAYKAAQQHQLQHGGPGPSAEFEIMKIVNEHNGQFEVIFKEN